MFRLFGRHPPEKQVDDRRSFLKAAGVVATATALAPRTLLGDAPGTIPDVPPTGMTELLVRRSAHGKLYWEPKRFQTKHKYRFVGSVGLMHWQNDPSDRWRDIDCTWKERNGLYMVNSVGYRVTFDPKHLIMTYKSLRGGELRLRLAKIDGKEPRVSKVEPFRPGGGSTATGSDRFRLRGVADDLDLVVVCRADAPEIYRRITAGKPVIEWEVEEDSAGRIGTNLGKLIGWDNHDLLDTSRVGRQKRPVEIEYAMSDVVAGAYSVTERITGRVKIRNPITGVPRWADGLAYPAFLDVSVSEITSQNNDDGHGYIPGASEVWTDGGNYVDFDATADPAWRFQTVDIPQGATINTATHTVYVHTAGTASAQMYGEAIDSAAVWTNSSANGPFRMSRTSANVTFSGGSTGDKVTNIPTIIQEIVNRGGWAQGSLRLGVLASASGTMVVMRSLNYHGSGAAGRLAADYTASGGPPGKRPLMLTGVG